jgi:ligand-binding sensor domain-containing protein/serine phosphatase RsbU (regulator of sigma subunit)
MSGKVKSLFVVLWMVCSGLSAQISNFKIYNEDNGLAQGYVYHLSQDKRGYLIASTGNGLSVFGGTVFKSYQIADGLAENFITTHFVDSKNNIWLGHFQEGISLLNRQTNRIVKINCPDLKNIRINSFAEDRHGNIYASTSGKGIVCIKADLSVQPIPAIPVETVTDFCFDKWGNFVVASDEGVTVYRLDKNLRQAEPPEEMTSLKGFRVSALAQNADSAFVWAAVNEKGVAAMQNDKGSYTVKLIVSSALNLHELDFRSLCFDPNGSLWVASFGEGLRKLSFSSKGELNLPVQTLSTKNGLSSNYIQAIYNDKEGNLWIGTYGSGLMEMSDNKFLFFPSAGTENDRAVNCIVSDIKGRILLGTDHGLKSIVPYLSNEAVPLVTGSGTFNWKVSALFYDSDGLIWIGTVDNGVFRYNASTGSMENISQKYGLGNLHINSLTGSGKIILVSTTDGAYIFNRADNTSLLLQTKDGLLHNNIYQSCLDHNGRIWFAAHGAPPFSYYEEKVTAYRNIEEMKSFNVSSILEDKTGNIWFATEGDGVFKYDGTIFSNYKVADGLGSNYCYSLACDKNNTIWIGHKSGLSEKKAWAANFTNYGKKDGILSPELNINAAYSDLQGNVWFGTSTGVLEYSKENDRPNTLPPSTQILGMTINNKYCPLPHDTALSAGYYSVKFDYLGVCLTHPENVRYRYILEGYETEWNNVGAQNRIAVYPRLADGDYTFKLLSCNNEGIWNSKPAIFAFKIRKYFWKTSWFFILSIVLIFLLVILIVQWRTRSLQKQSYVLEQLVSRKTEQLKKEKERVEQINLIIEAQNTDITDSINYAKRIQEAMLPSKKEIHDNLNCFIFYKPRDIVSGDFYWYSELNEAQIVAAVDCTGHGVPGAFMSLIGSTQLKNIITESGQGSPSEILGRLNKKIIDSLHQINSNFTSNDGMEIVLCSIQPQTRQVVFAGANRPLYLVRQGVLQEYPGSSFPIGGMAEAHTASYNEHIIPYIKGDMLYLTTDGFADQFGGQKNRKFSSKRLKELFCRISSLPVTDQDKELAAEFNAWKTDGMQIDDILVIGIQL